MGKPRMIILIRHAQSEGNQNREIHQMIPDHRAEEAGRRLRALLKPSDTLQIYTSPYRRTRETTEGILRTLTAQHDPDDPETPPSPFNRHNIKVWEEPRLREQDFGNFQPCSAEMERMWRERADYGHFFYRIPNGESAADAYDRVSGFNESLWRQFGDSDFPSVAVLVTHGLMSRVFLMKWYHWSVEYFEDLRNVGHCEFLVLKRQGEDGKYDLQNDLRTWSELKRQRAQEEAARNPSRRNTLTAFLKEEQKSSPAIPARQWGGCVDGCDHHNDHYPRRQQNAQKATAVPDVRLPPAAEQAKQDEEPDEDKKGDHAGPPEPSAPANLDGAADAPAAAPVSHPKPNPDHLHTLPSYLQPGRDAGGDHTPHEMSETEDADGYFHGKPKPQPKALAGVLERVKPQRRATPEDIERWVKESGMGRGLRADALGDEPEEDSGGDGVDVIEKAEAEDKSLRGSVY